MIGRRVISVVVALFGLAVALLSSTTIVITCCGGASMRWQQTLSSLVFGCITATATAVAALIAPRRDVCAPGTLSVAMVVLLFVGIALSAAESGILKFGDSAVVSLSGFLGAWVGYAVGQMVNRRQLPI